MYQVVCFLISENQLNLKFLIFKGIAVLNWEQPKEEMVAYRSFEPFVPLLMSHEKHPVQLWAVWALHHVTTRNSKFGSKNYIKFDV